MRKTIDNRRIAFCFILFVIASLLMGCGREGLPSMVVEGTVACGGEKVERGQIRFVPIDGTHGSTNVAAIRDGYYRIKSRGGVPQGRYRVEITAEKLTGRQIEAFNGTEMGMVDETIRLGPPEYAGPNSPLTAEITPQSDGRFNFDLPQK